MSNLQLTQEKLDALRSEYRPRRPCALLKYPRPKTKPEYQSIYPWLLPDETDPHFVFCAVCECRLSAKRSDLGKHEGSIKHSENAQRKARAEPAEASTESDLKWEYNDEDEGLLPFGATNENEDDEEEESLEGDREDTEPETEAEPACKQQRRISETDSQHSGMLDFLPLQVTINELPPAPQTMPIATQAPQPCRITIKKVSAPPATSSTAAVPLAHVAQSHEITSKATITPISAAGGHYSPKSYMPKPPSHPYQIQQLSPPRDSLDLFFDSICATVKALPPRLATEGKIRVMQLIGELELRAISEQETLPVSQPIIDLLACSAGPEGSGSSQQNATVASTTK